MPRAASRSAQAAREPSFRIPYPAAVREPSAARAGAKEAPRSSRSESTSFTERVMVSAVRPTSSARASSRSVAEPSWAAAFMA